MIIFNPTPPPAAAQPQAIMQIRCRLSAPADQFVSPASAAACPGPAPGVRGKRFVMARSMAVNIIAVGRAIIIVLRPAIPRTEPRLTG